MLTRSSWLIIVLLLTLLCAAASPSRSLGDDQPFPIKYPYRFEIQSGSYAWIVTPDLCEKTRLLEFDWDPEKRCLAVNGAQIFPPVDELSPLRDEERMKRIYQGFSIVNEFRIEQGSWVDAVFHYNNLVEETLRTLGKLCRMAISDSLPASELSQEYASLTADYPYSEIFEYEAGVELGEHGFTVYLRTPYGPMPQQTRYYQPQQKSLSPEELRASADTIVREIVAHYHLNPNVPHIAVISNGGASLRAFGSGAVTRIERAIHDAEIGSVERGGDATREVPYAILRRIAESSGGKK